MPENRSIEETLRQLQTPLTIKDDDVDEGRHKDHPDDPLIHWNVTIYHGFKGVSYENFRRISADRSTVSSSSSIKVKKIVNTSTEVTSLDSSPRCITGCVYVCPVSTNQIQDGAR